ncbi:MAG: hypothetical protein KatS3mg032_2170 [Cyclobacteriaceae bacterium]|nr:MAG: hypothetical protein KatS3mg032_2170 [Cyclobacteriaceae bacterium]
MPAIQYCTDNAAMVAVVAHHKFLNGLFEPLDSVPLAQYPVGV